MKENPVIVVPVVAGIGNALMAVPMVREIKRRLPAARVVVLARTKPMAEVFQRLPEADEVILTGGGIANLLKQIRTTRRLRADAYVIPFPSNRWQYALLALTSGARRKILHRYPVGKVSALGFIPFERVDARRGIHDVEQNLLLVEQLVSRTANPQAGEDSTQDARGDDTREVVAPRAREDDPSRAREVDPSDAREVDAGDVREVGTRHAREVDARDVRQLGMSHAHEVDARDMREVGTRPAKAVEAPDAPTSSIHAPTFALTDTDRASVLPACGFAVNQPFILIHAGSAQTILARAKRWPPESYAGLIEALHAQTNLPVVLVEGPDETGVAASITAHCKTYSPIVHPLRGPLAGAAALLERATLYVGSDSGLAHLAAAVGTPAVTLFAPADPDRVCPYGNRDLVVQTPCACSPCFLYPWEATKPAMKCAPPYCIEKITVDSVVERALAALARRENAAGRK